MSNVHWILSQTCFQMTGETLSTVPHMTNNDVWLLGFNTLEEGASFLYGSEAFLQPL